MSDRYKIVDRSQSGHCCFAYTVVDTSRPCLLDESGEIYVGPYGPEYEQVCECFTWEDADNICTALNFVESET